MGDLSDALRRRDQDEAARRESERERERLARLEGTDPEQLRRGAEMGREFVEQARALGFKPDRLYEEIWETRSTGSKYKRSSENHRVGRKLLFEAYNIAPPDTYSGSCWISTAGRRVFEHHHSYEHQGLIRSRTRTVHGWRDKPLLLDAVWVDDDGWGMALSYKVLDLMTNFLRPR